MCLLISKPAHVDFHESWLADFVQKNPDGAGILTFKNGAVDMQKILSPTVGEWIDFYNKHAAGHKALIHLRMRTHGDVNYANVHPYTVGKTGAYLMHNGVLHTGNDRDRSKSDTWHYIRDYILPAVSGRVGMVHTANFINKVGKHIGPSNKFAIMTADGRTAIINRGSGYTWAGAWFSNAYAWSSDCATGMSRVKSAVK